ncbi:MAG: M55 family metallopeptidase [Candidatus Heimdallarchaeota archaeon]|nr:M55 family metallopeptidase [Candidatus Heimdallarchaeota archaeon]
MKKYVFTMIISLMFNSSLFSQTTKELKVFISVDMEGITGVVNWEEVNREGKDYDYFRKIMTKETNAAIEGAVAAGATEIVVRDSHASARNILPEMLDKRALLLRDWSGGPLTMMEGINESFDAVIFIGYHAKAGTPDATLEHTMSSRSITDVSINGVSLPEAGINALIAGYYDVPVVFLSGDQAICKQAMDLFGEVETVQVKEGIGKSALNLHPEVAWEKIQEGVKKALMNLNRFKPYKIKSPYTLELTLMNEELVYVGKLYPGAKRTGDWELTYTNDDLLMVIKAMRWMF